MRTKSAMSKRRRRRLRGKTKAQTYAYVHYFRYYGVYKYESAALDYFDVKKRSRAEADSDWWANYPEQVYRYNNVNFVERSVCFADENEATTHVVERKLRMLDNFGILFSRDVYDFVPWKITVERRHPNYRRVLKTIDLGTRK